MDRYSKDVLTPGWQRAGQQKTTDVPMELGMVVEEPSTGFVGAIVKWENGVVVLEDRKLKRRSFPVGPGFLLEGRPVKLCIPPRTGRAAGRRTSIVVVAEGARDFRFIDVWQAVKPERIGIKRWPEVPMDVDWKKGTLAALNLPHANQKDVAQAWQAILARVTSFRDLDPAFVTEMEKLIDFVTQDHDFG